MNLHPEVVLEGEKVNKLGAKFFLETIAADSELTFTADEKELEPGKDEYEFEVSVEGGEVPEGLYKVIVAIIGEYTKGTPQLIAIDETSLIQISDPY